MPSRARLLWMGALGIASCDPTLADYCAPTAPECTGGDGGTPDAALVTDSATQDERSADGGQDVGPSSDVSRCDGTKAPHDDPCVINESYGVFVSSLGSDASAGTRASPVLTIGHAMDLAKSAVKRVYVCAGSFGEHLVVGAARDGVNVYGGLDCATWKYGSGNRVLVVPPPPGYALELDGLQVGVTFEDAEFDAPTAVNPGESSIAVFASKSSGVAFHRVTVVADVAADGAVGASVGPNPDGDASAHSSNWYGTRPNFPELNGNNAGDAGGAPTTTCTCADRSSSTGGQGGGPFNIPTPSAGQPPYGDGGAGAAGINGNQCNSQGGGSNGGDAPNAGADMPGSALGALSAAGWTPGAGIAGMAGKPGQGGGGGGNGRLSRGAGGGGACGGCGGVGGKPGLGGGSSIALLSYQSSVALVTCLLTAKAAGNGGSGGSGEQGQNGGVMGGNGTLGGCPGGAGGEGAGGNGAQGGPGGLSLGIGYSGLGPAIDGALVVQAASQSGVMLGSAGAGGAGGAKGAAASSGTGAAGTNGASGPSGVAIAVRQLP